MSGLTREDDRRGATPVAVLSDRYWRSSFGADPGVVGRPVRGNRAVRAQPDGGTRSESAHRQRPHRHGRQRPTRGAGDSPERAAAFFQELRERLAGNPAIDSIATSFGSGGMVAALILLVSMAVSLRPALRAARVDLATVLRSE